MVERQRDCRQDRRQHDLSGDAPGARKGFLRLAAGVSLRAGTDWIFASHHKKGLVPRSAGVLGQDYLRPAAVKAGVIPEGDRGRFGWHNLRHSLGTLLASKDLSLPLIQSMLRHSKPTTTAIYTHRVNSAQMVAQEKLLDAIKLTSAVA